MSYLCKRRDHTAARDKLLRLERRLEQAERERDAQLAVMFRQGRRMRMPARDDGYELRTYRAVSIAHTGVLWFIDEATGKRTSFRPAELVRALRADLLELL